MPSLIELFVDRNGHVFLLSNDSDLLKKKGEAIRQYSRNTYPSTQVGEVFIQFFDSTRILKENRQLFQDEFDRVQSYCQSMEEDEKTTYLKEDGWMPERNRVYHEEADSILRKEYQYVLDLDLILPIVVKTIFDLSHRYRGGIGIRINCHAAALVASGILPTLGKEFSGEIKPDEQYGIDEIMIDELAPGDIISLNNDHSMVYLDEDICISANGRESSMKIYSIKEVVSIYYKDMQYKVIQNLSGYARFYRKNPNIHYSESLLQSIRDQQLLMVDYSHYYLSEPISSVMRQMIKEFSKSIMRQHLTGESTAILKRLQSLFPIHKTYDGLNLYNVITDIHTARLFHSMSNEQGLRILSDPLTWANLHETLQQKDVQKDKPISFEIIISKQGFFAPPGPAKKRDIPLVTQGTKNNLNHDRLIRCAVSFCSLLLGFSLVYQFCFANMEKQDLSINPFPP